LVVVPASLLENWQRELRRWCPALKTVVYYGKHRVVVRKRLSDLRCGPALLNAWLGRCVRVAHSRNLERIAYACIIRRPMTVCLPSFACRERLIKGEQVDDDLSDLADADLLAELAQNHKAAEAARMAAADYDFDDDPYGAGQLHESGGCRAPVVGWKLWLRIGGE
jgi:hypothetical protein